MARGRRGERVRREADVTGIARQARTELPVVEENGDESVVLAAGALMTGLIGVRAAASRVSATNHRRRCRK